MAPRVQVGNYTSVVGCMARSVRDTARWFDVCNGHDARDMFSLPRVDGWEAGLGSFTDGLRGARVAVVPDWGGAVVSPAMWEVLSEAADHLIADRRPAARRASTRRCRRWARPGASAA